jgi:hypothetical protein
MCFLLVVLCALKSFKEKRGKKVIGFSFKFFYEFLY